MLNSVFDIDFDPPPHSCPLIASTRRLRQTTETILTHKYYYKIIRTVFLSLLKFDNLVLRPTDRDIFSFHFKDERCGFAVFFFCQELFDQSTNNLVIRSNHKIQFIYIILLHIICGAALLRYC